MKEYLLTREIVETRGITRNQLNAIRSKYSKRLPKPIMVGTVLLWPLSAVKALDQILAEEAKPTAKA